MTDKKSNISGSPFKENKLLEGIGLICLLSAMCTLLMFVYTLYYNTRIEQIIALIIFIGFSVGFILNRLRWNKATWYYMTLYPPTAFMMLILLIGGYFGQAVGFATMVFLAFITYRKKPKIRILIIGYDILAFIIPTLYISIYGPILGTVDLPLDEILVFIASLAWLSLTFRMYDEHKTRTYTSALEKHNKILRINELALNKAQSDLLEQNKKLSLLNKELNKKNKQIEEFTFIVTHDLKSPLNNINVIAKELQKQPTSTTVGDYSDYFKHLEGSSTRMTNLVHGLLDYAEIGNTVHLEVIDCNSLVEQIVLDHSEIIKKSKAKIVYNNLPKIVGRERDLRMLFQNLIHNAIKFTHKNTTPVVTINAEITPDFYRFKVADNGIGISDDQKKNIFRAFHKLNHQSKFEGSGIGLYGSKRVVDLHNGEIWVDSELGKGSTFYFTISKDLTHQISN